MNLHKNYSVFENSFTFVSNLHVKWLAKYVWNFCEMELSEDCLFHEIFTVNQQPES